MKQVRLIWPELDPSQVTTFADYRCSDCSAKTTTVAGSTLSTLQSKRVIRKVGLLLIEALATLLDEVERFCGLADERNAFHFRPRFATRR